MKVKITSAPVSFWYVNKIGQTVEVKDELRFGDFQVADDSELRLISADDCEIVEE